MPTNHVLKCHIYALLEHLQQRLPLHLPKQPIPVPYHSFQGLYIPSIWSIRSVQRMVLQCILSHWQCKWAGCLQSKLVTNLVQGSACELCWCGNEREDIHFRLFFQGVWWCLNLMPQSSMMPFSSCPSKSPVAGLWLVTVHLPICWKYFLGSLNFNAQKAKNQLC